MLGPILGGIFPMLGGMKGGGGIWPDIEVGGPEKGGMPEGGTGGGIIGGAPDVGGGIGAPMGGGTGGGRLVLVDMPMDTGGAAPIIGWMGGGGGGAPVPEGAGGCKGGGASANSWWGLSVSDNGFLAAIIRSAAEPCLSPLESFLKA